ncbi:MAG: ATP-binding protein [Candidatus Azobacteroides sp.]|nr:ATP-binding protein [Candidatus Azobacteroides sp.]
MQRNLFETLLSHLDKKEFTILTGARQVGKSTLLKQLEKHCRDNGKTTVFLNLENKPILNELDKSPLNIFNYLPNTPERVIVFIDEIQYLADPSNFLKLLYDDHVDKIKIVATGSSAFYLDDKFKDSLAGRKKIFFLPTCSFDEYLRLSGNDDLFNELVRIQTNPAAKSIQIEQLHQAWNSYMLYGGYPAVITEPDKQEKIARLQEIRDSYIKRDVLESGVQNEQAFYNLFRLLADQVGNLVNINELATTLRIKDNTVTNYLSVLQKCFHIVLLQPFYRNLRKELTKMPKVYLLDTGLRNCLLNNFQQPEERTDKGALWENTCFRLLIDKYGSDNVLFWRTTAGNEVDFVVPDIENPQAIEVKFDKNAIKESKYKIFKENYPEIPLSFAWIEPFDEEFFRRIN